MSSRKILLLISFIVLMGFLSRRIIGGVLGNEVQASSRHNFRLFLPLVQQSDQFANRTSAIWVNNMPPPTHQVALFRKKFHVSLMAVTPVLSIFADTRYEIWVDGEWLGRGPARFSRYYREYDQYLLPNLDPGDHLVAVLVQWSPNNRRSESITPYLRVNLTAKLTNKTEQLLRTDTSWKAIQSPAWQSNPSLVHSWGLIGATELLDLRALPSDWMLPQFSDVEWPQAVEIDPAGYSPPSLPIFLDKYDDDLPQTSQKFTISGTTGYIRYAPRSIAPLVQSLRDYEIIDQGYLSPGWKIMEILPDFGSTSHDYFVEFEVINPLVFRIYMLRGGNIPTPDSILVDGVELNWVMANLESPDIYQASLPLSVGQHILSVNGIPEGGVTLRLPAETIVWFDFPLVQGVHAGRRLLLSSYVSETSATFTSTFTSTLSHGISTPGMPSYFVIDLGRMVYGRLQMDVSGPEGAVVDVGWDERLSKTLAIPRPYPGSLHPPWNQVDSWVLDGSPRQISTIDARSGRYILVAVWTKAPVTFENIKIYEEHYPLSQSGQFQSSDLLLNRIWQVGVDSAFVNMTDAFTDTPWRERGQWWGDAFVIERVNRVAFGDFSLLKRGLLYMANGFDDFGQPQALAPNGFGTHMVDYGMLWVVDLQEYLQLTGDRTFVRSLYPTVLAFLKYLEKQENPTTGLLDFPDGHWATTDYIDTLAGMARKGQAVPVNAMYIETLSRSAILAEQLGDDQTATQLRSRAQQKTAQFNALFYLPDQECYQTGIYGGQSISPTLYSQAWPLAYGLVSPQNIEGVLQCLQTTLSSDPENANVGTYGMYWVLASYFQNGHVSEAIDLMKTYYGWMLSQGATTWWEHFGSNQDYSSSLSHGWGASPTWFLSTYVLGARQIGVDSWEVRPAFEGVSSVSGQIPVGQKVLRVEWQQIGCQERLLRIESPEKTSGQVVIPVDKSLTQITLNDNTIWDNGISYSDDLQFTSYQMALHLYDGNYLIRFRRVCP